jgi:hypothetical protein
VVSWGDARYLGRQHFGCPYTGKQGRKLPPCLQHQCRINLVVDKAVDLEDSTTQVFSILQDP